LPLADTLGCSLDALRGMAIEVAEAAEGEVMRLAEFEDDEGKKLWINPSQVVSVQAGPRPGTCQILTVGKVYLVRMDIAKAVQALNAAG